MNNRPDIVHLNTSIRPYSFRRDILFLLIARIFGVKVLFHIHGGFLDEFLKNQVFLVRAVVIKILKMANQIIVLSSAQKEALAKFHLQRKVMIVPNMIDAEKFSQNRKCKERLPVPPQHMALLFVASIFFKEKGVWETLQALSLIVKKHSKISLLLVGGDKEEYEMKRYSQEKGLQDSVIFTGNLSGQDLIDVFCSSNIFILPSYSEGFPLVILEAMAAGLPIIATPVGAIPEIIEEGINGFLVPPRDPSGLAEKIIFLIENKPLRESMGENNVRKIREKYDLKPVSVIFDKIYQNLIS